MKFRRAQKSELSAVINLFSESFKDYPLMTLFSSEQRDSAPFVIELYKVNTRVHFRKHLCFIGELEGQVVVAALLKKKNTSEIGFLDYAISGGWRLIKHLGLSDFLTFLKVNEEMGMACRQLNSTSWYLDSLAVDQRQQGKHLGSKIINQCLIPYIAQNDGGLLTLVTNTERNRQFYLKNGFKEFSNAHIKVGEQQLANFSFKRLIQQNK